MASLSVVANDCAAAGDCPVCGGDRAGDRKLAVGNFEVFPEVPQTSRAGTRQLRQTFRG